jgi:hypothetical protein
MERPEQSSERLRQGEEKLRETLKKQILADRRLMIEDDENDIQVWATYSPERHPGESSELEKTAHHSAKVRVKIRVRYRPLLPMMPFRTLVEEESEKVLAL